MREYLSVPPVPITAQEYEELPEDELLRHAEVVDGIIQVSPSPTPVHQLIANQVSFMLTSQLPPDVACLYAVDVRLNDVPLLVRQPDLVLVGKPLPRWLRPRDVILAVEIVSPSSITRDRLHKPMEYAQAGIPHYWRLEMELDNSVSLHAYRLDRTLYQQVGAFRDKVAKLAEPFLLEIDLTALT